MPFALPFLFAAVTTCSLDLAIGVSESDSLAVQDVVCAEVAQKNDGVQYRVRITKLGAQYVVRLATDRGTERHLVLTSLDEIPIAAPRLATAHAEEVTVGETLSVDNVVGGEARKPKAASSRVNAYLGMVGGGTVGAEPSAGGMLSISAGSANWSFVSSLRLTGDAFKTVGLYPLTVASFGLWKPTRDAPSSLGSLDAGVRHHLLDGDTSPFIGTGLGLTHTAIGTDGKTGLGAFAEVGLDVLRTRMAGGAFLVRFDAPAYALMGQWRPFGSLGFAMRL